MTQNSSGGVKEARMAHAHFAKRWVRSSAGPVTGFAAVLAAAVEASAGALLLAAAAPAAALGAALSFGFGVVLGFSPENDSKNTSKLSAILERFWSGVSSLFWPVRLADFCTSQVFSRADFACSMRSCMSGGTNAEVPESSYLKSSNIKQPFVFPPLEDSKKTNCEVCCPFHTPPP